MWSRPSYKILERQLNTELIDLAPYQIERIWVLPLAKDNSIQPAC
jgi:hypothetical protein